MNILKRIAPISLLVIGLTALVVLVLIAGGSRGVGAQTNNAPTGLPVVLLSAESPGVLAASTWRIADADGLPYTGVPSNGIEGYNFNYQWIRVDGGTDVDVGTDSLRYQLADSDFGKQFKVRVTFTDRASNDESLISVPFGPVLKPPPLASPATLVGNTGQSPTATRTITSDYAMNFRLGRHGQGYDIRSVAIDLAAAPSSLSVSLWTGGPHGGPNAGTRKAKLFDFESPPSFQAGLNQFTAPAGVHALQNVRYWIVLSDFGGSLSITETSSDAEDAGSEPGASLANEAGGGSSVLRLAVQGSRRTSGTLAANFAQPASGSQEIISLGDKVGFGIDLGAADLYLVRGMAIGMDDTTSSGSGFDNPFSFRSDNLSGAEHFDLYKTRNVNGLSVWTAPQGATVAGGGTYLFDWDDLSRDKGNGVDRVGAILTRLYAVEDDFDGKSDRPPAPGVSLAKGGFLTTIDNDHKTAVMAVYGEPLNAPGAEPGAGQQRLRLRGRHQQGGGPGLQHRLRGGRLPADGHRGQRRGLGRPGSRRCGGGVGGGARQLGGQAGGQALRPAQSHRLRGGGQLLRGAPGHGAGAGHRLRAGLDPQRRQRAPAAADPERQRGFRQPGNVLDRGLLLPGRRRGQPDRGRQLQRGGDRGVRQPEQQARHRPAGGLPLGRRRRPAGGRHLRH